MKNLILVTNDDGIDSPGLRAAAEAVIELGDVICVAPQTQQTSMSRAFPKDPRNGIISAQSFRIGDALVPAYGVHGSPALAVSHAVLELCDRKPALCISGINYGENLGLSVFTSGTIGAAFEADSYDIPAIAVSREAPISQHHSSEFSAMDWAASKHFISKFASELLAMRLPPYFAVLNINLPHDATPSTPFEVTRQSRQNHFVLARPSKRIFAEPYRLRVEVKTDTATLEEDSDIACFCHRHHVSVTPLTWNLSCQLDWPDSTLKR